MSPREMWGRSALLAAVGLGLLAVGVLATGAPDGVGVALVVIGAGLFTLGVTLPLLGGFKLSTSGFEATFRERDAEVRSAVGPRGDELVHLAAWLGTDPEAGPRLLEDALVRTYIRPVQADPREQVLRELTRLARTHAAVRDQPPAPEAAPPPGEDARTFMGALRDLPPERRSAVVLDLLGGVAADEAGRILGRTREKVEEDLADGLARLPGLLAKAAGGLG